MTIRMKCMIKCSYNEYIWSLVHVCKKNKWFNLSILLLCLNCMILLNDFFTSEAPIYVIINQKENFTRCVLTSIRLRLIFSILVSFTSGIFALIMESCLFFYIQPPTQGEKKKESHRNNNKLNNQKVNIFHFIHQ